MAAEASQLQPEAGPQETPKEAPAQETPAQEAPAAEHWTKKPFEGGSLQAAEKAAEVRGMGKLLGEQAAAETQKFDEETKSWWGRAKDRLFRKKDGEAQTELTPAAAKGEAEILAEIEKADATFASFRKEMAQIMASGDESQLRVLEGNLQRASDQLMEEVAAEGVTESDQWKKALKTGVQPEITTAGAQLNYVTKRLADVRAKLAGKMPAPGAPAEAPAAPEAAVAQPTPEAAPATEQTQAEKDLDDDIARGVAEFEAEQAVKPPAKPIPSLNEVLTGIPDDELAKRWKPADPGPMTPEESPEQPSKPDLANAERDELLKASAGKPGEKMVDEYLKVRGLTEDAHGTIVGRSFDPLKGEIRLTYADGSIYHKYSTGTVLRELPGGLQEAVPSLPMTKEEEKAKRVEEMAARVDAAVRQEDMAARVDASLEEEDAAAGQAPVAGEIESKPAAPEPAPEAAKVIVAEEAPEPTPPAREPVLATHFDHLGQDEQGNATEAEAPPQPEASAPIESAVAPEAPVEAPPAAAPEAAPERKESGLDKLEAKMDAAAAEIIKMMPEEAKSPNTFRAKVGKLPTKKILEAYVASGAVTEAEAKEIDGELKVAGEEVNEFRKKLAQSAQKKLKG